MPTVEDTDTMSSGKRLLGILIPIVCAILVAQDFILPVEKLLLFIVFATLMWWILLKDKVYEPTGVARIYYFVVIALCGLLTLLFVVSADNVHDRRLINGSIYCITEKSMFDERIIELTRYSFSGKQRIQEEVLSTNNDCELKISDQYGDIRLEGCGRQW